MKRSQGVWIHSPLVDLALIAYSWLPLYLVYAALALIDPDLACDAHTRLSCPRTIELMIALALLVTRVHRHYSLAFAYGDRAEFERRREFYLWVPLVALLIIGPSAAYRLFPPGALRLTLVAIYSLVTATAGAWNVYHVIMQKYGFLRIYSAKAGHGDARVEKHLFFSWIALVTAASAMKYAPRADEIISYGPPEIQFLTDYTWLLPGAALALLFPALAYAGYFTVRWLRAEKAHYSPASLPKLLFALSVAALLATFVHSLLIGVLAFGFSHAFEYCVFVNVYAARRYSPAPSRPWLFRLLVDHPILSNALLVGVVYGLYVVFKLPEVRPWGALIAYANFTSILHFLYDGLLWRVRDPETRGYLLSLNPA